MATGKGQGGQPMQQPGAAGMVPPGGVASLMGQMPPGMGGPMPQQPQFPLFAALQQQAPNLPQASQPQGGSFIAPQPRGGSFIAPQPKGGMGQGSKRPSGVGMGLASMLGGRR